MTVHCDWCGYPLDDDDDIGIFRLHKKCRDAMEKQQKAGADVIAIMAKNYCERKDD